MNADMPDELNKSLYLRFKSSVFFVLWLVTNFRASIRFILRDQTSSSEDDFLLKTDLILYQKDFIVSPMTTKKPIIADKIALPEPGSI